MEYSNSFYRFLIEFYIFEVIFEYQENSLKIDSKLINPCIHFLGVTIAALMVIAAASMELDWQREFHEKIC